MKQFLLPLFSFLSLFGAVEQIDDLCHKFSREFTVLNIGAGDGEFAFDLSNEFENARVIMVEDNNPQSRSLADALVEKCSESEKENIPILVNKRLGKTDIKTLAGCGYFDVVTILGDSAYTGKQFYLLNMDTYAKSLLTLGWHTFIEAENESDLCTSLEKLDPAYFYKRDGTTLFHFINEKKALARAHFFSRAHLRSIEVTFEKNIEIKYGEAPFRTLILQRPAGLSLLDFKGLYGAYPTIKELEKSFQGLKLDRKLSFYPHELFVTGKGLKLAASHHSIDDYKPFEKDFVKAIIKAATKSEIKALLKD